MKTLKSFEFKETVTGHSSYDWTTILSGKIVQLESGVDYTCKDQTFRMLSYKQAKKRGQTIKVAKVEGGLVVQASEPPATPPGENGAAEEGTTSKRSRRVVAE